MGVTRKERLLKAMLEDNAEGCRIGMTREERLLASVSKKACDNDALEGGGTGGGGLPKGDGPNMMLVTDADGKAEWQERTHWKEEGLLDVLPETTINVADFGEDASDLPIMQPFSSPVVVGEEYVVTYNGSEYTSTAFELQISAEAPPLPALGNQGAIGGEDTGEPFIVIYVPEDMIEMGGGIPGMLMALDGSTLITVRIQHEGVKYHKLDPGYLPIPMTSGTVYILPETKADVDGETGTAMFADPLQGEIVIGKKYTVTYNGTEYVCTAWAAPSEAGTDAPALGNKAAIGEDDTGEPFVFMSVPEDMLETTGGIHAMLSPMDGATEVTVSIRIEGDAKIDNSALDMDWVPKKGDVGATILPEMAVTKNTKLPSDISWPSSGEKVIVYFDRVRYECSVMVVDNASNSFIGNFSLLATSALDTGEPFLIVIANGGAITSVYFKGDTGLTQAHRIAVYADGRGRKGDDIIPASFLPDRGVFYVNATQESIDSEHKADKTITEAYEAYYSGRMVCLRLAGVGGLNYSVLCWPSEISHTSASFFSITGTHLTSVEWNSDGKIVVTEMGV